MSDLIANHSCCSFSCLSSHGSPEQIAKAGQVDPDEQDHAQGDCQGVVGDQTGLDVAQALADRTDAGRHAVDSRVDNPDVDHLPEHDRKPVERLDEDPTVQLVEAPLFEEEHVEAVVALGHGNGIDQALDVGRPGEGDAADRHQGGDDAERPEGRGGNVVATGRAMLFLGGVLAFGGHARGPLFGVLPVGGAALTLSGR